MVVVVAVVVVLIVLVVTVMVLVVVVVVDHTSRTIISCISRWNCSGIHKKPYTTLVNVKAFRHRPLAS